MLMATVCLHMIDGQEVWFRAPQHQVHQLVVSRHKSTPPAETKKEHLVITEKKVPIFVDLTRIRKILIT
jgi:hypothetical protein